MSAAYERVMAALSAGGWKARADGRERMRAQCPAHRGTDLNLAVAAGDQGVLLSCHSHGCSAAEIADALGLQLADLFDRDGRATYNYGGGHIVTRTRTASGKSIRQRGARSVTSLWTPEGSAAIADSSLVVIGEGEKVADALARMGARCAATWPGGSGGIGKVDLSPLAGRDVIVCPDNDAPGEKVLERLTERLQGVARSVKVWRTPAAFGDVDGLNDAADLYLAGGSLDDLIAEQLEAPRAAGPDPDRTAEEADVAAGQGSWAPIDLGGILDDLLAGRRSAATPSLLRRVDGRRLFYRGKVNGIHGDSNAGKSWIALLATAQELEAGEHVVYVDLEDSPADVMARLLALSVAPEAIRKAFHYVQPEEAFHGASESFLAMIDSLAPSLVVIDSTGEGLALEGAKPNADEDVTEWFARVPKRIARRGPGVLLLDHMTKAGDNNLWPIGSQRKRAAITGAQYLLESVTPFSRSQGGASRMTCAKDRPGTFTRGERVAIMQVTPMDAGAVDLRLLPVATKAAEPTKSRAEEDAEWVILTYQDQWPSSRSLMARTKWGRDRALAALRLAKRDPGSLQDHPGSSGDPDPLPYRERITKITEAPKVIS